MVAVSETRGSSKLTEAQSDWYFKHFGARYRYVQEQPLRPPRRIRRGRKITMADVKLADAISETQKAARKHMRLEVP